MSAGGPAIPLPDLASGPAARRDLHVRIVIALLVAMVGVKCLRFSGGGLWLGGAAIDFGAFHIVGRLVWSGDLAAAYDFAAFTQLQVAASGQAGAMPWTYPPQFALLLAPLALLPGWAAYGLFVAATLAAYLAVLKRIAGDDDAPVLVLMFPALATTIASGQNGFLTAALLGWVCLSLPTRPVLAGVALGLMVIKPHLAIAAAIYLLATRQWRAIAAAAAVVLLSSLLCTLLFGPAIWIAWLGAIRESAAFLEQGRYPLFRMISAYAALYTAGLPAAAALVAQAVVAALALMAVALAMRRAATPRLAPGALACASVMMSPYAYDYDLPIVGIGLAFLVPALPRLGSLRDRAALYGAVLLANGYGLLQSAWLSDPQRAAAPALAAVALLAALGLLLWMLRPDALRNSPVAGPA